MTAGLRCRSLAVCLLGWLYSTRVSAAPPPPPSLLPPSSVSATGISASEIRLTWNDPNSSETGYQIERSLDASTGFALAASVGKNVTTWVDSGLPAGASRYYRIRATAKRNAVSPYSNVVGGTTLAPPPPTSTPEPPPPTATPTPEPPPPTATPTPSLPPASPSGLVAAAASSSQISVSWTDNSSNEIGFKVERGSSASGPWTFVGATALTGFGDGNLAPATTYWYRVQSYNAAGESAYSNTASATTQSSPPEAPGGLTATAASSARIDLTWSDASTNEAGFKIERSTATNGWSEIATAAAGETSYSNTGLGPATTYSYRVRAYNAAGDSGWSNTASATTPSGGASRWSKRFGDTTDDRVRAVRIGASGRVATAGYFQGITDFGGGATTSYTHASIGPTRDVFVSCYDPAGNHVWSRALGGVGSEEGMSVVLDSADNLIVTGYQGSFQVDYGAGSQGTNGSNDIFVAKYSPTGGHVWSKTIGGTGNESGNGVAVDAAGNVLVTGGIDAAGSGVNFGGGALMSAGFQDVFLVKYTPTGAHVWSQRFGGASTDAGVAVGVDSQGNVYVTGNFEGTVDFGTGPLTSAGGKDVFVAKYTAGGAPVWSRRFGGASNDFAGGLAVDGPGDVAISGRFAGTIDFGGGNLTSAGGEDGYLAKLAGASGSHLWSKRFGGTTNDSAAGVAADEAGNVSVTGHYNGSVDFGGGVLQSLSIDVYAARYNAAGAHLWSRRYGDSNYQFGTAVAASSAGDVVLGGYFNYNIDFGTGILTSAGGSTFDAHLTVVGP